MISIYRNLRLEEKDSIRLLSINETLQDGKLDISLETTTLHRRPHYHTLSYTWRNPLGIRMYAVKDDTLHPVICNGIDVNVLPNLFAALSMLATSRFKNDLFWIDALCIDQNGDVDFSEKASQVVLMPQIYRCSDNVIVFFGPCDHDDQAAISLIKAVGNLRQKDRAAVLPSNLRSSSLVSLIGKEATEMQSWQSLARFFCRSYFRRAWVRQEVLSAGSPIAFCGEVEMDWTHVVKVSELLSTTVWTDIFQREDFYGSDRFKPYHDGPAKLRASSFQSSGGGEDVLLYNLIRGRGYLCSDPRDKIFSIISTSRIPHLIDYSLSMEEISFRTAKAILEQRDDLLLLSYVEGSDWTRFQHAVPSWVPDWSVEDELGLGITGYKRYSAAGESRRYMALIGTTLEVKGQFIDTVSTVGESKLEVNQGRACLTWLQIVKEIAQRDSTNEACFDVLWRVLVTNTAPILPAPSRLGDCFFHWLARHLKPHLIRQDDSGDLLSKLLSELSGIASNDERDRFRIFSQPFAIDGHAADEFALFYGHSLRQRVFNTVLNFLGMGTTSLRSGDEVFLVYGSRIPLVLRKLQHDAYTLVGGCYLHGAMHGEMLKKDCDQIIRIV